MDKTPNNQYIVKVKEDTDGEQYLEIPQDLLTILGWKVGDEVKWEQIEICEKWGEHLGLTLSKKKKNKESE